MSLEDTGAEAPPPTKGTDSIARQGSAWQQVVALSVPRHGHICWALTVSSPTPVPLSSVIPYTHFDVQFLEKFGVTFRREGETVTLKCTLLVTPDLKRVQPRAEWYRDGECCGE